MRSVDCKAVLATAKGAEVGHISVEVAQPQYAFYEPCHLPQPHTHAQTHLHGQAVLEGGVATNGLSPALSGGIRRPNQIGIEPDFH